MSSPFQIFRKHQKIMLVVLVGLSMLSFVIFDAIQQAGNIGEMPPMLTVLTLALLIGAVAWVMGINNHKSSEYGSIGLIAGAALGLVVILYTRKSDMVTRGEFALTQTELNSLAATRFNANRFLALAVEKTNPDLGDFEKNMLIQRNQFTFGHPEHQQTQDLILGELLRREAAKVGMALPDAAVHDFIKETTNNKMSREVFQEIRRDLRVSEAEVVDSIRQELLAREAALTLYSRIDLPPAVDWEFSQQLQVRQTATTAGVPVAQFVDDKVEPPAAELQSLFDQHQLNYPGVTPDGKIKEGLPGFYQPPRVKLAYVTPDYAAFELQLADSVTDQEIEARYQRDHVNAVKPPATGPLIPDFAIPGLDGPQLTPPATPQGDGTTPAAEAPAGTTPPVADPAAPAATNPPPAGEAPAATPPAADAPNPPATEPEPKSDGENGCDDAAAEKPSEKPADQPAADLPAGDAPASPPADLPAAPAGETPAILTPEPAPPVPSAPVRPLDDELKAEIREQILAEKTNAAIETAMADAIEKIRNEISIKVRSPLESPDRLTPEAATKQIQEYAAAHNFRYVESELLAYDELLKSDDVPVAQFRLQTRNFLSQPTVADELFSTAPSSTFQPQQALDRDRADKVIDRAIYWKLQHEKSYAPEDLKEERVRNAVVKTWRELNARKLAEERAKAIAETVRKSDKPMLETLADVTITGEASSQLLSIVQTGQFSRIRQQIVPAMTLQGFDFAPVRSTVPGVELAGDDFMTTVFEQLRPGEVGVAPNADRSVYYVVKIDTRIPATDEEWTTVRNNFLSGQNDPALERLGAEMMSRDVPHWANELFRTYGVEVPESDDGAD